MWAVRGVCVTWIFIHAPIVFGYIMHDVKHSLWLGTYIVALVLSLVACGGTTPTASFATPTAVLAAQVLGETVVTTPLPLALTAWQSPDGRVQLRVPREWPVESHNDAGRALWIWNAPGQRGLISLLMISSPIALPDTMRQELMLQTIKGLNATIVGDVRRDARGRLIAEATSAEHNRDGADISMWVQVIVQQFEDSIAIVVMSVPERDIALIQPLIGQMVDELVIAPLPTTTPLPTATPAPFTADTFDVSDGKWFEGDDLRRAITINNGIYRIYLRMADSYYLSAPAEIARANQKIAVDTAFEGSARIGTALRFHARADETRDYVVCWISPLQRFGCFRSDGDQWQAIQEVTDSAVIYPDRTNHIEFGVSGTHYTFAVNGALLAEFDTDMPELGVPALYVETFDAAAGGIFDNVKTS